MVLWIFKAGASQHPLCALYGQVFRACANVSAHVLFLPLVVAMCHVYSCAPDETWLSTSLQCFDDSHSAVLVGVTTVLLAFTVGAVLGKRALQSTLMPVLRVG